MITEDYVSFEVAKLLKEKGFDEQCSAFYRNEDILNCGIAFHVCDEMVLLHPDFIKSPTHQMAMKWLREEYSIFIDISSRFSKNADKDVCFSYSCKKLIDTHKSSYEIGDGEWLNHEDAVEAALKYSLENLI